MTLDKLGWNHYFEKNFIPYKEQGLAAGRVFLEHKHLYRIYTESGEILAEVSGKMRYEALSPHDFPAVGDWVAVSPCPGETKAIIQAVLPRKSKFSRKVAGKTTEEQILAANIDIIFLVSSLNHDFNLRRLERYLTMTWESGANPVIVLSKADLCPNIPEYLAQVETIAFGVPIVIISSATGLGFEQLTMYLGSGSTAALLGSSGVGKSSLINRLAGTEMLKVGSIREDDSRGRHTTTFRQLILLPSGGLIIDNPGMREFQLWDTPDGLDGTFADIESLSQNCRFNDCHHQSEPGCAVKEALASGKLAPDRLENFRKLQKELVFLEAKQNQSMALKVKQNQKNLSKLIRKL